MNEQPQPIKPGDVMLCTPTREFPTASFKVTILEPDKGFPGFWWVRPEHGKFTVRYHSSALEPLE